jgi:hypothetical protein
VNVEEQHRAIVLLAWCDHWERVRDDAVDREPDEWQDEPGNFGGTVVDDQGELRIGPGEGGKRDNGRYAEHVAM